MEMEESISSAVRIFVCDRRKIGGRDIKIDISDTKSYADFRKKLQKVSFYEESETKLN